MGEIVNLRTVKKRRARAEAAADAQRQRLLHGRTKAEKQLEKLEKDRAERALDSASLRSPEPGEPV